MSTRELFAKLERAGATYAVMGEEVRVFVPPSSSSSTGNVIVGHWVCCSLGAGGIDWESVDELGAALGKGMES